MKKISLILAAFALVLGISQCRKQETPMGKLVTQDVTFTSSFNNGAKFGVDNTTDPAALKLTWDAGDLIIVTDDANPANESTLRCTEVSENGKSGTFTGTITCQENANLTFSYNPIDYKNQDGSLQIYLEGTSGYQESGNYEVNMTMPCAILKLDLAELATAEGVDVYVKIGDATEPVAKISSVKTADSRVYLLLPLQASGETTLTFSNDTKTITKTYNLAPNSFNSAGGNGGYAPVEPTFSVSETTTVEFAPGNLWYGKADGESTAAFHFEANQWDFASTWDASHVSHFFWSNTTDWQTSGKEPYAESYSCNTQTTGDVFFTNAMKTTANPDFHMDGETGKNQWRTLSNGEWAYLLNTSGSSGRTDESRFAKAKVKDVCGLLIFPDNYSGTTSGDGIANVNATDEEEFPTSNIPDNTWKAMESAGAVFLPAARLRQNTDMYSVGSEGYYWSSTPHNTMKANAYYMRFNSDDVYTNDRSRNRNGGLSVRLVRDVK